MRRKAYFFVLLAEVRGKKRGADHIQDDVVIHHVSLCSKFESIHFGLRI